MMSVLCLESFGGCTAESLVGLGSPLRWVLCGACPGYFRLWVARARQGVEGIWVVLLYLSDVPCPITNQLDKRKPKESEHEGRLAWDGATQVSLVLHSWLF